MFVKAFFKKVKMKLKYILPIIIILGLVVNYFYRKPKFINGEKPIDFEIVIKNGKKISLSQFKGKYVLIDFWGSWCGPCRADNPKIAQLYNKYNTLTFTDASGFEIISIGIETNESDWQNAIQNDQLYWENHYSSLKRFDDPIAKLYGVRQIPTKYLINPDGYIMGVDLSADEIDKLLSPKIKK